MLTFDMNNTYKGLGVSRGLDRGVQVYYDNNLLLEEGMGLGACALQTNGYTYFATVKTIIKSGEGKFEVFLEIDQQLVWNILGVNARLITRMLEKLVTNIYMKQEKRQKSYLKLGNLLRKVFRIRSRFITVAQQAEVVMVVAVGNNLVDIDLSLKTQVKDGNRKFFVMNELGGNHFNIGLVNGAVRPPPTGWQKIEENVELYSRKFKLAFSMAEKQIPKNVVSTLNWGRESISDSYCWAGFESELSWNTQQFDHYKYVIKFKEVSL